MGGSLSDHFLLLHTIFSSLRVSRYMHQYSVFLLNLYNFCHVYVHCPHCSSILGTLKWILLETLLTSLKSARLCFSLDGLDAAVHTLTSASWLDLINHSVSPCFEMNRTDSFLNENKQPLYIYEPKLLAVQALQTLSLVLTVEACCQSMQRNLWS